MDQQRFDVGQIVQRFIEAMNLQGIKVDKVFLFGSHAKGEANDNSDIDLIVISRDFSNMPAWRRWEVMGKAIAQIMEPIEPLAYAPEEIEKCMEREANFIRHIITQPETVEYRL